MGARKRRQAASGLRGGRPHEELGVEYYPEWGIAPGLEALAHVTVRGGEWLGVYNAPSSKGASQGTPERELLSAGRSGQALARRVRRLGMSGPFFVCRARSRRGLLKMIEPSQPDYFTKLRYRAFEAIAEARKRLDPGYLLHPGDPEARAAEMRKATDFLRDVANAARAEGKHRGDKATAGENRSTLAVLFWLATLKSLKEIAIDQVGADHFEGRWRSLSVRVARFSKKVCATLRAPYVPNVNLASFLAEGLRSDALLRHHFRDLPGICFPDHLPALRQAIREGTKRGSRKPA